VSFEPRVIGQTHEAEPTDDFALELPPELAALGEQLTADSAHLSDRYPAKQPATVGDVAAPTASRRSFGRIGLRFGAAAAAILVAIVGWKLGSPEHAANVSRPTASTVPAKNVADSDGKSRRPATGVMDLRGMQHVEEVGIELPQRSKHSMADEVTLLRKQLNGFEKVINALQTELAARKQAQADDQKTIETLRAEITQLKGEK
jgi:hypothetical protein